MSPQNRFSELFLKTKESLDETVDRFRLRDEKKRLDLELKELQELRGFSLKEAKQKIFLKRMNLLEQVISNNQYLDTNSVVLKEFEFILNEFLQKELIQKCVENSSTQAFVPVSVMATSDGLSKTKQFFLNTLKPNIQLFGTPSHFYIQDYFEKSQMISGIINRRKGDFAMRQPEELGKLIENNESISADLGKIVEAIRCLRNEMDFFIKEAEMEHSLIEWKKDAINSVSEMVWSAPVKFLKEIIGLGFGAKGGSPSLKPILDSVCSLLSRQVIAGIKLTSSSIKTLITITKSKMSSYDTRA